MINIKIQKRLLLDQLEVLRDLEKQEQQELRESRFEILLKREPQKVKISGFNKYLFTLENWGELDKNSLGILEEYNGLCKIFDRALTDIEDYYKTSQHKVLLESLIEVSKNNNHYKTALISSNIFEEKVK